MKKPKKKRPKTAPGGRLVLCYYGNATESAHFGATLVCTSIFKPRGAPLCKKHADRGRKKKCCRKMTRKEAKFFSSAQAWRSVFGGATLDWKGRPITIRRRPERLQATSRHPQVEEPWREDHDYWPPERRVLVEAKPKPRFVKVLEE